MAEAAGLGLRRGPREGRSSRSACPDDVTLHGHPSGPELAPTPYRSIRGLVIGFYPNATISRIQICVSCDLVVFSPIEVNYDGENVPTWGIPSEFHSDRGTHVTGVRVRPICSTGPTPRRPLREPHVPTARPRLSSVRPQGLPSPWAKRLPRGASRPEISCSSLLQATGHPARLEGWPVSQPH